MEGDTVLVVSFTGCCAFREEAHAKLAAEVS